MSESIENKRQVIGCETEIRSTKPYVKPIVRCEHVFEVRALSCGKKQTTQRNCKYNRQNS